MATIKIVSRINSEVNAEEVESAAIILLYFSFAEKPKVQRCKVVPKRASNPNITTGTIAFLKLKISAIRQKTPKPDIAISVFICIS